MARPPQAAHLGLWQGRLHPLNRKGFLHLISTTQQTLDVTVTASGRLPSLPSLHTPQTSRFPQDGQGHSVVHAWAWQSEWEPLGSDG